MKKTLKRIMYILAIAILITLIVSYVLYATYWPKDSRIEPNETLVSYFHESYDDCRQDFLGRTSNLTEFDSVEKGRIAVPSKSDDELFIDWIYIPARGARDKLLILNSGLHGIEGYTGSAIQCMFVEEFLTSDFPDNVGVLLIHGLNPYGFKYRRKVTESNIDLNRNCVRGVQGFDIANDGYAELSGLLMPTAPVNLNTLTNRFFYLTAIWKIIKSSMAVLRQAALQGQYQFDKGFYYGGRSYEPQIQSMKPLLSSKIREYKMFLNIDLHTAYGERGALHLFVNKPEDQVVEERIKRVFKDRNIDWGSTDDFYTINGQYVEWVNSLVPEVPGIPMLFEFGTMNSQKTFGSIKSLQIMIVENQGVHHGYRNSKTEQKVKSLFSEMYYPSSPAWRSRVMLEARDMITSMLDNYVAMQLE